MKTRVVFAIVFFNILAFADHPNEGKIAVDQVVEEAMKGNLEIKQAEQLLKAAESAEHSAIGSFAPKISIDGGPVASRLDNQSASGTALYGKAEWNLYKGGADLAVRKKAQAERELQVRKLQVLKARVKREVSRIYYEALFLQESIALKEKAIALNSEQMKLAVIKRNSGFTSNGDVLEFELRQSTLQSDLVLLKQELEKRQRELNILLNRSEVTQVVSFKGHLHREAKRFDRSELLKKISEQNLELVEAKTEVQLLELEKKANFSEFLPRVDLEGKYGKLASEERVYDENSNYSIMLRVSIPLFSGLDTYHTNKSYGARVVGRQLSFEHKKNSLIADLDNTLNLIKTLNQRLDLEEKNVNRSEEYYKITQAEYKRGVKNSPDMVGAAERLLEAKIRNLEYRRDLMIAQLKIQDLVSAVD